jgi:hypothetical protein
MKNRNTKITNMSALTPGSQKIVTGLELYHFYSTHQLSVRLLTDLTVTKVPYTANFSTHQSVVSYCLPIQYHVGRVA